MADATQYLGMEGLQNQEPMLQTDENGQMTIGGIQTGRGVYQEGHGVSHANMPPVSAEDEVTDIDDYEMVGPEFFAQIKEPAFTINVNKTTANAASVRMLPHADYVKYLINRKQQRLILMPCAENDIRGYRWAREKNGRRYAADRTGRIFVLHICRAMGWNPDNRYKVMGKKSLAKGEEVLVFDLSVPQCYEKSPAKDKSGASLDQQILSGWNGKFGPTYGEDKRSLEIDTFDGYTVFSINDPGKSRKNREIEEVAVTSDGDPVESVVDAATSTTGDLAANVTESPKTDASGEAEAEHESIDQTKPATEEWAGPVSSPGGSVDEEDGHEQ